MSEIGNEMKMFLWLGDVSYTQKLSIGYRGYGPKVGLSEGKIHLCLECMAIAFMSCSCANPGFRTFRKPVPAHFLIDSIVPLLRNNESHSWIRKVL